MVEIKKRTKGKLNSDIGTPEIYKYYLKRVKPIESLAGGLTTGSYKIKPKEFGKILKDANKAVLDLIVKENFEFKIPCSLGFLSMRQSKVKYKLDNNGELMVRNLSIDFKATKDLWKVDEDAYKARSVVYHTNEHTNGNRMAYWWKKSKRPPFGCKVYYFLPCREMKRRPAKLLKNKELSLMFFEEQTKAQKNLLIYNNKNRA
jgi:hypothetical protein